MDKLECTNGKYNRRISIDTKHLHFKTGSVVEEGEYFHKTILRQLEIH